MPNPKGINQYSKGKGAGTFTHGTKSKNSSNAAQKDSKSPGAAIKAIAKKASSANAKAGGLANRKFKNK